jgi:signal transduction histidine kinase
MLRKPTYEDLELTVSRLLADLNEKSTENVRMKRAFLSMISHELRTPMHAILGFAQLIVKSELSKEEKDEYMALIEQSGNHLITVVDTMIDASLLDSGDLRLKLSNCNLQEFLGQLYCHFGLERRKMERFSVALLKSVNLPQEDFFFLTDVDRLNQILSNLLENALKQTHKGIIEMGCFIAGTSHLQFFVTDSGGQLLGRRLGEIQNYSVEEEKSQYMCGSDLGLSIARDLVELMGGHIWAESNEYRGATICFRIPLLMNEESREAPFEYKVNYVKKNIA